jgi:signal peptidase I
MNILKIIIEFVMDILETVVFIGSLFIVIYLFIVQPNQIKGASMDTTFASGDYILTSKVTYKLRPIHRGDIVVFKSLANPNIDYIKRIIGLPGDKVMINDSGVYVNDRLLPETYLHVKTNLWDRGYMKADIPVKVPDDMVFVLGDNRPRSSDSREFGSVPIDNIIGQVFYRYFPVAKMGPITNPLPKDLQSYRSLDTFFASPFFNFDHQSS